jgi:hypothetical protein
MRPSLNIFTTGVHGADRAAELQIAWFDAVDETHETYRAWCGAERGDRGDAFAAYQAALDREQAAARALQLELQPPRPLPPL